MKSDAIIAPLMGIFLNFLLITSSFAQAAPSNQDIMRANQLLSDSHFDDALSIYKTWTHSGFNSKALYFNLGHIYDQQGIPGWAMFYFKKAEKLAPGDNLVRERIVALQEKIRDRFMIPVENENPFHLILKPWKFWTIQQATSYLLPVIWFFWIHLLGYQVSGISKNLFFFRPLQYVLILLMVLLLIQCFRIIQFHNKNEAVVIAPEVHVYRGADAKSPMIQTVHAGLPVLYESTIGTWIKIKLSNGQVGWVKKSQLSDRI
jgi:hypothetical protein